MFEGIVQTLAGLALIVLALIVLVVGGTVATTVYLAMCLAYVVALVATKVGR